MVIPRSKPRSQFESSLLIRHVPKVNYIFKL